MAKVFGLNIPSEYLEFWQQLFYVGWRTDGISGGHFNVVPKKTWYTRREKKAMAGRGYMRDMAAEWNALSDIEKATFGENEWGNAGRAFTTYLRNNGNRKTQGLETVAVQDFCAAKSEYIKILDTSGSVKLTHTFNTNESAARRVDYARTAREATPIDLSTRTQNSVRLWYVVSEAELIGSPAGTMKQKITTQQPGQIPIATTKTTVLDYRPGLKVYESEHPSTAPAPSAPVIQHEVEITMPAQKMTVFFPVAEITAAGQTGASERLVNFEGALDMGHRWGGHLRTIKNPWTVTAAEGQCELGQSIICKVSA